jgi:ABC-2 type transporter
MFGFQRNPGKFFIYFAAIALAQLTSESIGMLFAMAVASADMAIILLSIVLILLLTGFLTSKTPVYYEWIEHLNFLRCAVRCRPPAAAGAAAVDAAVPRSSGTCAECMGMDCAGVCTSACSATRVLQSMHASHKAGYSLSLGSCRYANSAIFRNEMTGLELTAADGTEVSGEELLRQNNLNNNRSIGANLGILLSFMAFVRLAALAALHLSYRKRWL